MRGLPNTLLPHNPLIIKAAFRVYAGIDKFVTTYIIPWLLKHYSGYMWGLPNMLPLHNPLIIKAAFKVYVGIAKYVTTT